MTRKNYFELIQDMGFDPYKEMDNLIALLEKKEYLGRNSYGSSLEETISDLFLSYKNRGTIISYSNMINHIQRNIPNKTQQLFVFSEFLEDFFKELWEELTDEEQQFFFILDKNIMTFLELSNHELITLENGNQIIVEKNVYASEVSQIVSETSIQDAIKVLEYNHFANKGNIERKKEILISLAAYLEPLKDELNASEELKEVMKVNNNKIIAVAKLFDMYNNLGLRHNNNEQYHLKMTEEELEQWYDDIYTSTLFVILSLDEARILSKLKTLRNG